MLNPNFSWSKSKIVDQAQAYHSNRGTGNLTSTSNINNGPQIRGINGNPEDRPLAQSIRQPLNNAGKVNKQKLQVYFPNHFASHIQSWRDLPANPLLNPIPVAYQLSSPHHAFRTNNIGENRPQERVGDVHTHDHYANGSNNLHEGASYFPHDNRTHQAFNSTDHHAYSEAKPEDFPFFCAACKRGFYSEFKFKAHQETHLYCDFPGCNFTCRSDKAYKMEEHKDLLHNRPDAPNLADTEQYLNQRKSRFPTTENIQSKVEELYYKAARGCVLPDERRRWMRRHGIVIRKRPRTETAYIASGSLHPEENSAATNKTTEDSLTDLVQKAPQDGAEDNEDSLSAFSSNEAGSGGEKETNESRFSSSSRVSGDDEADPDEEFIDPTAVDDDNEIMKKEGRYPTFEGKHMSQVREVESETKADNGSAEVEAGSSSTQTVKGPRKEDHMKKTRIVPMGPNGTLTTRQKVTLIREKYAESKLVPRFYVCQRCGKKGEHWVSDCPTKGDPVYDRHLNWGEAKLERAPKVHSKQQNEEEEKQEDLDATCVNGKNKEDADKEEDPNSAEFSSNDLREPQTQRIIPKEEDFMDTEPKENDQEAEAEEVEDDFLPPPVENARGDGGKTFTKVIAPVAAAKMNRKGRGHRTAEVPKKETLYEKLTEEDRINEQGVLLQAIRFFVKRDFFEPPQ